MTRPPSRFDPAPGGVLPPAADPPPAHAPAPPAVAPPAAGRPETVETRPDAAVAVATPPPTPLTVEAPADHLYEGDCLTVLPTLPANSVDLVLCDLPYGTTRNKWDSVIDLRSLWREYRRVLKPRGAVVLTSQGIFTARLILSNEAWFRYKIIWVKSKPTNFLNVRVQPLRKHEDICIFYGRHPTYNPQMTRGLPYDKGVRKDQLSGSYGDFRPAQVRSDGDRYPSDVIYFKTAESEPERTVWHPTQKPVDLGRYLVRTFSNPGDLVLDNAFGSGSFLVAAHLEARRFCGIEKNRAVRRFKRQEVDYLEVARVRLEAFGAAPQIVRAAGSSPRDPGSRRVSARSGPALRRPRIAAPSRPEARSLRCRAVSGRPTRRPGAAPARRRSMSHRGRDCPVSRPARAAALLPFPKVHGFTRPVSPLLPAASKLQVSITPLGEAARPVHSRGPAAGVSRPVGSEKH